MSGVSAQTLAYVAEADQKRKKKRLALALSIAGVVVLVGVVLLIARLMHPSPPPLDADAIVLAKFMATSQYAKLDEDTKNEYRKQLWRNPENRKKIFAATQSGAISEAEMEQGRKLMMDSFIARQRAEMAEFFKLKPGKERLAYLNKKIDDDEERRRQRSTTRPSTQPGGVATGNRGPGGAGGPGGPGGPGRSGGGRGDPARMKQREDNFPADLRAATTEYRREMDDARLARGLPAGGGGRGGR